MPRATADNPGGTGCVPFTNCAIQTSKLPLALFTLESDGRKKWVSAAKRFVLFVKLGGYADADGTNCFPGDHVLSNGSHSSERHISRLRRDLRELGFVLPDGFVRIPGSQTGAHTRKWKLMLPLAAQTALGLNDRTNGTNRTDSDTNRTGSSTQPDRFDTPKTADVPETVEDNPDFAPLPAIYPPHVPGEPLDGRKDEQEKSEVLQRVWDYYIARLSKNPKLLSFTTTRRKLGAARLRECLAKTNGDVEKAEALLRLAVDALAESAWHCGENPQKKRYDSWEANLFKTQEQMEGWFEKT